MVGCGSLFVHAYVLLSYFVYYWFVVIYERVNRPFRLNSSTLLRQVDIKSPLNIFHALHIGVLLLAMNLSGLIPLLIGVVLVLPSEFKKKLFVLDSLV